MDETFPEDKSRDYFIDLVLGLEFCKCIVFVCFVVCCCCLFLFLFLFLFLL